MSNYCSKMSYFLHFAGKSNVFYLLVTSGGEEIQSFISCFFHSQIYLIVKKRFCFWHAHQQTAMAFTLALTSTATSNTFFFWKETGVFNFFCHGRVHDCDLHDHRVHHCVHHGHLAPHDLHDHLGRLHFYDVDDCPTSTVANLPNLFVCFE